MLLQRRKETMRQLIRGIAFLYLIYIASPTCAQTFRLEQKSDSLNVLVLETRGKDGKVVRTSRWELPYPVYRLATGDVDGDGKAEAMVGVVKATRFYPEKGNRIFVFKNLRGNIRPLWMGSRLGGDLVDFAFVNGRLRSLEQSADGKRFAVGVYSWSRFGPAFEKYLITNSTRHESMEVFLGHKSPSGHRAGSHPAGSMQIR